MDVLEKQAGTSGAWPVACADSCGRRRVTYGVICEGVCRVPVSGRIADRAGGWDSQTKLFSDCVLTLSATSTQSTP
ncbi:hypothetical protein GCM10010151_09420 [Actinoallomurus spadix]|uniref:Uncharacterized protein n=1 Tax=Actinoallomurus spadix TaxID=79912 RepID=A0ABN0W096_9ACTN